MAKLRLPASALLLVLASFCPSAASQDSSLSVAWEKGFPDDIDWYVRTSSGVLLVRCGDTLFAIDGADGRELWSKKNFDIKGMRGRNLLEIPGTPYLLTKRARPDASEGLGSLHLLNLWTGEYQLLEFNVGDLGQVVPLYDRERFWLFTANGSQLRSLFEHRFEKSDWKSKFPSLPRTETEPGGSRLYRLYDSDGQLYVHIFGGMSFSVTRMDLANGKKVWDFARGYWTDFRETADLLFRGEKVLFAGKDVFALDAGTGKPIWSARHLGEIAQLVQDHDVLLGSGKKGLFALDPSTGAVRWRVESDGHATNLVFSPEGNTLLFADKSGLVTVNAANGEVLARYPLNLREEPLRIQRVGVKLLLLLTKKEMLLLDTDAHQVLWTEDLPNFAFDGVTFLVSHPLPEVGSFELKPRRRAVLKTIGQIAVGVAVGLAAGFRPPDEARTAIASAELTRRLQNNWEGLKQRAGQNQVWQTILERLEASVHVDQLDMPTFATELERENQWKLWRIDPATGQRQEWILAGEQPDFIPAFGLAYTYNDKTLRAFKLGSHSEPNPVP